MDLKRQENETSLDYQRRLVYGKLIDKTLSDVDYAELSDYVYDRHYASDVARRMMYGSCKTLQAIDEELLKIMREQNNVSAEDTTAALDAKILELQRERQKFYDYRSAFNKTQRDRARQEELNEIIIDCLNGGSLPELIFSTEIPSKVSDNDLIVTLSDIHYGADVHNVWNTYDPDICAHMMGEYVNKIIDIAARHHSENCYVLCAGDIISGNIHQSIAITNKENVIRQIMGVSELISEFLAKLSWSFDSVHFVSVAGNHSRMTQSKDDALKDERLDDLVEWYLKARLQRATNIIFDGIDVDSTMKLVDIRGKQYCIVHGDYDGSDSKIRSLQSMIPNKIYAVVSGHLHHNEVKSSHGIKSIMSGSFLGMDDYCIQKRIYGEPQQLVCVCTDNGVECYYDINLKE